MKSCRRFLLNFLCAVALLAGLAPFASPVVALSPDIVISQVYGGGGNTGAPYKNDFVELFNRGASSVSLSGWSVQYASATGTGNFGANPVALLSGSLAPGQYYLVQLAGGTNGVALPTPDATGTANMSGSAGKVALVTSTAGLACNGGSTVCSAAQLALIKDLVGYGGANFYETAAAPLLSNTTSASRAGNGCTETDNNAADFTAGAPAPRNTASPLNPCPIGDAAPQVSTTYPVNGATDFPVGANLTVTFSEPVDTADPWFTLSCSTSGTVAVTVSGGPSTFTLDPDVSLVDAETCTWTILATGITDQDTNDPPDNLAANYVVTFTPYDVCAQTYTPIYEIQGDGATTPIPGTVTTMGVVVGDYEVPTGSGQIRGFFLQDLTGDDDPATSDGIFVFNGTGTYDRVSLGEVVRVKGTASDYQGQTQISLAVSGASLAECGTGSVDPVDVTLPFDSVDYPERYEGMLVRLPQTLYVTENYQLGRFGEVILSSEDRLWQPTHLFAPGDPGVDAQLLANSLNQILLDDANNSENVDPIVFARGGLPLSASNTLRSGDSATGIVGVLNYTWGGNSTYSPNAYRVRPIHALGGSAYFEPTNPRPTAAPDVGGALRVAGMNLLNFFNTFGNDDCTLGVGGDATECRGAWDADEFARQWPKTVAAIVGTEADVIGVIELENDGYGPESAIAFLVDQLNAETAPGTYAFIDVDAETGQVNALGVDAIKVGLLYRPAAVTPVGQTAALNTEEFVNGGDLEPRNRPALAQAFEDPVSGGRFVVSVNHLKSKGSACDDPDAGDGQGNCSVVRTNAAAALTAWLADDPTGTGEPDALILGDLNSYAKEDPIAAIENAGYTNLIYEFGGDAAYSYVFDGMWGYLDHALGSEDLTPQVTGVAEWHINADEPSMLDYNEEYKSAGQLVTLYAPDQFRVSDHDVVLVGLDLVNYPPELGDITAPADPVLIGIPVDVSVSFTDPDWLDTHTATWDWGDGTTSDGTVTEDMGAGTITGQHTYTTPGLYTIQVTVEDNWGNSDSASYRYVVVYNPGGGYVTGGGWFTSPAGAYTPDPTFSGKAEFTFSAKYTKNAVVPVGDTLFQLKMPGFSFASTSYQWLVVDGTWAEFMGSGTVDGAGDYGFLLSAIDGLGKKAPGGDMIRIKIWDKVTGEVLYDNQMGAADDARPTMLIEFGSIAVHK